jgi:hypothetical protein
MVDKTTKVYFDPIHPGSNRKSKELIDDCLQWAGSVGVPKTRSYVRVANVCADIDIIPFNNDISTLQRAVVERVFTVKSKEGFSRPPRPKPGHFVSVMSDTHKLLVSKLPSTAPQSHSAFVESYRGRKRLIYQRALDDIVEGRSSLENDSKLKVFVKYEKTDVTSKIDPVPRVISPRDPKFNIRLGRYLKPLEKRIFKSIKKMFGHETVIKGFNAERSAELMHEKWGHFHDPVAIGLDASRFDQHVSLDALRWEHSIYLECFPQAKHRKRLERLLKCQEINHCSAQCEDGYLSYTVRGTRMSGDMNTSLGNCLLMCSLIHAYSKHCGVNLDLANNGDDCVVFMERRDIGKFQQGMDEWFHSMGFNMAVEEPVDEFEQLEFCQTKPVFDGDRFIMCRNPWTAIVKDSVFLQPYNEPVFKGWMDAMGMGGLALTGGLPIFQEFYNMYKRSGRKRKIDVELLPYNVRALGEGLSRGYRFVRDEARASFYLAFGITPDEQIELEKYYRNLNVGGPGGEYQPRPIFKEK